jgi:hypothetical protein
MSTEVKAAIVGEVRGGCWGVHCADKLYVGRTDV